MNVRITFLALGLLLAASTCCRAQVLRASDILQNVERGFQGIEDFEVTIQADINMERVRAPQMHATMYFKKPDKVHFTSPSFVMVPREGLVLNPSLLRERYDAALAGEEELEGRKILKVQLAAKETKTRLRQMLLWIDPSNWTIARMETVPYQGRVLRLAFTHTLEEGRFWLPHTLVASFETTSRDSTRRSDPDVPSPQVDGPQRPLRSGSISITYSNYKVNVGLSDELFEQQDRPVKQ